MTKMDSLCWSGLGILRRPSQWYSRLRTLQADLFLAQPVRLVWLEQAVDMPSTLGQGSESTTEGASLKSPHSSSSTESQRHQRLPLVVAASWISSSVSESCRYQTFPRWLGRVSNSCLCLDFPVHGASSWSSRWETGCVWLSSATMGTFRGSTENDAWWSRRFRSEWVFFGAIAE